MFSQHLSPEFSQGNLVSNPVNKTFPLHFPQPDGGHAEESALGIQMSD